MKVTARTVLKTGYGLGLLSLAEGRKIASRLKKELELNDEESQKLAKELVATSGAASKEVLKTTSRYFEKALIKSKLAKKSDIARVKKIFKRASH